MTQDRNGKEQPTLQPVVPGSLRESLRRGVADEAVRGKIKVTLRVSGGMPSRAYHLEFRATGDGDTRCELRAGFPRRQEDRAARIVGTDEVTRLIRDLLASGVLDTQSEPPRFLPDTLVGYLEIADGESVYQAYFAADAEQAATQNKAPRPELMKAVDAVYAAAARLMGKRSARQVKP